MSLQLISRPIESYKWSLAYRYQMACSPGTWARHASLHRFLQPLPCDETGRFNRMDLLLPGKAERCWCDRWWFPNSRWNQLGPSNKLYVIVLWYAIAWSVDHGLTIDFWPAFYGDLRDFCSIGHVVISFLGLVQPRKLSATPARESSVVLVAARPIAPEEELTFVYVSAPDAVLLVQYAMPPEEGNAHNMAGEMREGE